MDELQAILERIGTDNPPTAQELRDARDSAKALLKAEAKNPARDLAVMQSLKVAPEQIAEALTEAEAVEAAEEETVKALLSDVLDEDELAALEAEAETPTEPAEPSQDDLEKEPVLAGGGVRILSLGEAAARVRDRPQPPEPPATPSGFRTLVLGREQDRPVSLEDIRKTFHEFTRGTQHTAGKNNLIRQERVAPDGWLLDENIGRRTSQVDAVVSPEAVAAAGGCCILPEPLREQTVLSSTARPIAASLPSFGVQNTGALTFYPPVCMPQDGAFIWTCEDDAAVDPEDDATWKTCVEFECDETVVTTVEALYHCITIGNFQRFFDGERWRAVLQTLLAQESRIAEARLFSKMRASVTSTHVLGDTGSVYVSYIQGIGQAAAIMRQDQRLADVQLRLTAPFWLETAMHNDLVARRVVHVQDPGATRALIASALGSEGVNVTWSQDIDIIDDNPVSSGPLADFPDIAHMTLAPEGYYTYLDAGSFDLGTEIRDMNLTRQNAVAAFAEEFWGLMSRGCAAFALDLPVSVCQVADGCEPLS
jgi:hypothetical protein